MISNDAERAITVSRVKACCGGEAELMPMSVWSKRNFFPSKIGLGVIFALLGVLILVVWVATDSVSRTMSPV